MKQNGNKKKQKQKAINQGSRPIRRKSRGVDSTIPVSYAEPFVAPDPVINTRGKLTNIRHSEYFDDVVFASYPFYLNKGNTDGYPIQPGRPALWTWLARMGVLYEKYRINELAFEYKTGVATTHDGMIAMMVDYDARDAAPQSLQQMMANEVKYTDAVYKNHILRVPRVSLRRAGDKQGFLFTRASNSSVTGGDQKTYDFGKLWVAVGGSSLTDAAQKCGKLIVHYDIDFAMPQQNIPAQIKQGSLQITGSGSVSKTAPFGTSPTIAGGLAWGAANASLRISEPGQYLVHAFLTGSGLAAGDAVFAPASAAEATITVPVDIANAAGTLQEVLFLINQPAVQTALYTLTVAAATTVTACVLRCARYAPSSNQGYDLSTGNPLALNEVPLAFED